MTSKVESKCSALLGKRRRSPLDQLPPPAISSKPLTPFSIVDILSKPCVKRRRPHLISHLESSPSGRPLLGQSSPLCALEELASKTFKGLEVSVLQAAEGKSLLCSLFLHLLFTLSPHFQNNLTRIIQFIKWK